MHNGLGEGMSPHPNEVLMHRAWEAVANGDVEDLRTVVGEKAAWTATGANPWAGRHEGFDAILDLLARIGEEMETFDANITDTLVSEGRVATLLHATARIGGHQFECDYLLLMNVDHELITEVWSCPLDPQAILDFWARVRDAQGLSARLH
jgi:ketosteroid isomerase-like protein